MTLTVFGDMVKIFSILYRRGNLLFMGYYLTTTESYIPNDCRLDTGTNPLCTYNAITSESRVNGKSKAAG